MWMTFNGVFVADVWLALGGVVEDGAADGKVTLYGNTGGRSHKP